MKRLQEVQHDRRLLARGAYERWQAFAAIKDLPELGKPNIDGSIPKPIIAASTPVQKSRFVERQRLRATFESPAYRSLRVATERMIGATLDFVDLPPDEQALKAGRPVARLVVLGGHGIVPEGFATGFLVASDVLLTNHHVFRNAAEARNTGAQFLYERVEEGFREGLIFELDPDRFFVNNEALDYALVAVKHTSLRGASLDQFQFLPLIEAKGKIEKGNPVNIIQHPRGMPKQYATVNNRLIDLRDDGFLLYETDTQQGSSGSPVFNRWWETIGLHHCGVPKMEDGKLVTVDGRHVSVDEDIEDDKLVWIANEGIRVSALVESFKAQTLDGPDRTAILERIILNTGDMLRAVAEKSPIVVATAPVAPPGTAVVAPVVPGIAAAAITMNFSGPVTIVTGDANATPAVVLGSAVPDRAAGEGVAATAGFLEKSLRFDEDYDSRKDHGYDPGFLAGWRVPLPGLSDKLAAKSLQRAGKPWVLKYHHFSLVMHRPRRLLIWAASNVDYSPAARRFTKTRKEYGGESWRLDPRVALAAPGLQIEDGNFYDPATKIDRGHIVRREDCCWGASAKEAEFGNSDTYHWTNCTPQSQGFNQAGQKGVWGKFEEHIQREAKAIGGRVSVLSGPVLNARDPEHGYEGELSIRVPMEFWKIVLCVSDDGDGPVRRAYGFIFDQSEPVARLGFERMDFSDYQISQRSVAAIARKTGIVFPASISKADVLRPGGPNESLGGDRPVFIREVGEVVLR